MKLHKPGQLLFSDSDTQKNLQRCSRPSVYVDAGLNCVTMTCECFKF